MHLLLPYFPCELLSLEIPQGFHFEVDVLLEAVCEQRILSFFVFYPLYLCQSFRLRFLEFIELQRFVAVFFRLFRIRLGYDAATHRPPSENLDLSLPRLYGALYAPEFAFEL